MLKTILNKLTYRPNVMNDFTIVVIVLSIVVTAIGTSFYAAELYSD